MQDNRQPVPFYIIEIYRINGTERDFDHRFMTLTFDEAVEKADMNARNLGAIEARMTMCYFRSHEIVPMGIRCYQQDGTPDFYSVKTGIKEPQT